MPKKMEQALKRQARKKGLTGKRADAYVYGTMRKKAGWKPKRERANAKKTTSKKTARKRPARRKAGRST